MSLFFVTKDFHSNIGHTQFYSIVAQFYDMKKDNREDHTGVMSVRVISAKDLMKC